MRVIIYSFLIPGSHSIKLSVNQKEYKPNTTVFLFISSSFFSLSHDFLIRLLKLSLILCHSSHSQNESGKWILIIFEVSLTVELVVSFSIIPPIHVVLFIRKNIFLYFLFLSLSPLPFPFIYFLLLFVTLSYSVISLVLCVLFDFSFLLAGNLTSG